MSLQKIPIDELSPSPFNTRVKIDPEGIADLAESLKRIGQIESIMVRPLGDRYEIVTGERRWGALKYAGIPEARCIVREMSDTEAMMAQWEENENRVGYSDYAKALKLSQIAEAQRLSQRELADKIGKSLGYVNNHLQMLKLTPVFTMVNALNLLYEMNERQARAILSAPEGLLPTVCRDVEEHYEAEGALPTAKVISSIIQSLRFYSEIEEAEVAVPAGTPELLPSNSIRYCPPRTLRPEAPATLDTAVSKLLDEVPEIPEADAEIDPKLSPEEYIEDYFKRHPLDNESSRAFLRWDLKDKYGIPNEQARKLIEKVRAPSRAKLITKEPIVTKPKVPTTTCPLCGRSGADRNQILMHIEDPDLAQLRPQRRLHRRRGRAHPKPQRGIHNYGASGQGPLLAARRSETHLGPGAPARETWNSDNTLTPF